MKQKIIFLKGLPASGKSTWSKQYCIDNPEFVRINKDELRIQIGSPTYSSTIENGIIGIQREMGNLILKIGKSLIVDDTNFAKKHEEYWRMVADMNSVDFEIKFFDNMVFSIQLTGKNGNDAYVATLVNEIRYLVEDKRLRKHRKFIYKKQNPHITSSLPLINNINTD